jgi:catechol 2,3-dioxygenase-like lactoylglutathione lyase family enzyme
MGLSHVAFVAIHVSDLPRARRFWVDGLGFAPLSHLVVDGRSPTAIELGLDELHTEGLFCERDGMRIQLQHQVRPPHVALPPIRQQLGLSHFGVRVDDMDDALERVVRYGGSVIDGRRHRDEERGSEVARVTDPDGVRIELLLMPGDPTAMPGQPITSP